MSKKMKLDFNLVLLNVDGSDAKDPAGKILKLNEILAGNLANSMRGDPIKFWDWSRALFKDGYLDVDRSDFDRLKKFVEDLEVLSMAVKAQLLERFILSPSTL